MTTKTRKSEQDQAGSRKISDPLIALEEKIKIYVWEIYSLQEKNAELEKSVSDLKSENYRLKKELERFPGSQGSVVLDRKTEFLDKDQATRVLNKEDFNTQILKPGQDTGSPKTDNADTESTRKIR